MWVPLSDNRVYLGSIQPGETQIALLSIVKSCPRPRSARSKSQVSLYCLCLGWVRKNQRIAKEISFFPFLFVCLLCLVLGWVRVFCITGLVKKRHYLVFSKAAFDQTLPEKFTTPPSLCISQNDANFRKYFLKLHVFANHRVTQPCPALMASDNRAGRICRCGEAHSFPGFLSALPCPDHLFRRVQEAGQIHPGQEHLLTIPVVL